MSQLQHRLRHPKPQLRRPGRSIAAFEAAIPLATRLIACGVRARIAVPLRALVLGALMFSASPTWAAPTDAEKETARSLMDDGDRLRAAQDNAGALQRYQAAHDIMNVPTTGIEVAKTLQDLGKLVEARRTAIEVANLPVTAGEPEVMAAARQEAAGLATQLATRIPAVLIQVWPKEVQASILVDSVQLPAAAIGLPYKTNPGEHVVQVSAPGYQTTEQRFRLDEGASTTVSVNLVALADPVPPPPAVTTEQPPPEPVPSSSEPQDRTLTYVAFGIAGAGAVLGTVTGVLSLNKASAAKDHCDGNVCSPEASDDIDSSKSLATFSNIGFGVAIAASVWGLYEVLSEPSGTQAALPPTAPSTPQVSVSLVPGLAEAVLRGTF